MRSRPRLLLSALILLCIALVLPFVILRPFVPSFEEVVTNHTPPVLVGALLSACLLAIAAFAKTAAGRAAIFGPAFAVLSIAWTWWVETIEPGHGHPAVGWGILLSYVFVGLVIPAMLLMLGVAAWKRERLFVVTLIAAALSVALLEMDRFVMDTVAQYMSGVKTASLDRLAQSVNCRLYGDALRWTRANCQGGVRASRRR